MMKILFQSNIWREHAYDRLLDCIREQGIDYQEVDLVPFTEDFKQDVVIEPTVVFGSNRFVNVCRSKGYPTFKSFEPTENFYPREFWVNGYGYWAYWGHLQIDCPRFIKPKTEKFFTGCVVESQEDLDKIQLSTSFIDNPDDEHIWVSDPVNLAREIRFFVVGGEIITASYYRINGRNEHRICSPGDDPEAWDKVRQILESGNGSNIDTAFVLDLGYVTYPDWHEGCVWRIVELNNFNSSGLYAADVGAILSALNCLNFTYSATGMV